MLRRFRVEGLKGTEHFHWNGGCYRQFDILVAEDDTPPEALRHLLFYPDCLVARGVVTEMPTHTPPETEPEPPAPVAEE